LSILECLSLHGLRPDAVTHSSSLAALEKLGLWQKSLTLLEAAMRSGYRLGVVAVNSCISAIGKGLEWQRSLFLLRSLGWQGLAPDKTSFGSACSACE
ncbi:unnamed protein product, partial [Polarella glacialis]